MITCKDCGAAISTHDHVYSGLCGECLMRHKQGKGGFSKCEPPTRPHDKNYATIETTVYFECGYCGQPLEANTHHDHGRITISPCKHCLEQARGEILKKLLSYENKGFTGPTIS